MRTLRIPTSQADISPAFMADVVANVRKLSNIGGTGCAVTETPNGISIDVPVPEKGFWAIIGGNPNIPASATGSQPNLAAFIDQPSQASYTDLQSEDHRYYQWQAANWTLESTISLADTLLETSVQVGSAASQNASFAYPMQGYSTKYVIVNRAREINDNPVPPGAFVWLTKGTQYSINVVVPGTGPGTGNQTLVCQEYLFSYAPRAIHFQLWENLWMVPQTGVAPNSTGSQTPGAALALEVFDGPDGAEVPIDVNGNPDASKMIVVFDPSYAWNSSATEAKPPQFIGLGRGYIATPGSGNTPPWNTPDEGWAVYWGDYPYAGITRSDGQTRLFPWYVIFNCRTPYLMAGCGSSDPNIGPGGTAVQLAGAFVTGDNKISTAIVGPIRVADTNGILKQWYEGSAQWGFWGHWSSVVCAGSVNGWTIDGMLDIGTARTCVANISATFTDASGTATLDTGTIVPIDGAPLSDAATAALTTVGNKGFYGYSGTSYTDGGNGNGSAVGDLVTIRQTGLGSSLTAWQEWEIIAVERMGFTGSQNIGGVDFWFGQGAYFGTGPGDSGFKPINGGTQDAPPSIAASAE